MTEKTQLDPSTTALLLLHFQYGPLSEGKCLPLAGEAAVFADRLRADGTTVGFVNLGFEEDEAEAVPASHPMLGGLAASGMMRVGSPEAGNVGPLQPEEGDIVVVNTRFGGFSTTELDAELRTRGIRTLVLAGVATGAVVLTTALEAGDRDYEVVVAGDLTADPDPSVHRTVLDAILPRVGRVVTTSAIVTG